MAKKLQPEQIDGYVIVEAEPTTPRNLTASESGQVFTNEGATSQIIFNLPDAFAQLRYRFTVQDVDGIQITASTGDTIRVLADVSATGGSISSTTIGSTIDLVAINSTEWVAVSSHGIWIGVGPVIGSGATVLVSADDTLDGYLEDKVTAGLNISLSVLSPGGNEDLQVGTSETLGLIQQVGDPTTIDNYGSLYSKDVDGYAELFYLDDYGNPVQITSLGSLNIPDGFISFDSNELNPDTTTGAETTLVLTSAPVEDDALSMYRNGLLMRQVTVLSDDYQEYTLAGAAITFLASNDPGDWYFSRYMDSYSTIVSGGGGGGGGGSTNFLGLSDTPGSYAGSASKMVSVNGGATGLEFTSNTLDTSYNGGNTIIVDGAPVTLNASGGAGLEIDGYVILNEILDPVANGNSGIVYVKEFDGYSELFYMDDYGLSTQITNKGAAVGGGGGGGTPNDDELDPASTVGTETSLSLANTPLVAANKFSGRDLDVFRNGVEMRWIASLGSDPNQWTYNSGLNRVEFVASGSSGDWYHANYRS